MIIYAEYAFGRIKDLLSPLSGVFGDLSKDIRDKWAEIWADMPKDVVGFVQEA